MIHLRAAISGHLEASPVNALVGGRIYHQEAPQNATYPLVLFHKQAGTPIWAFDGKPVANDLWTVKAVDTRSSQTEPIATAIDNALNGATLDSGTLHVQRASDVSYPEPAEGKTYRHLGGMYRIYEKET